MNIRSILRAFFATAVCGFILASTPALADDLVAQFEGSAPGNANGHMVTMVGLKLVSNQKNVAVAIPNDEPKKGETPKPKKELDDAVKKLTKGQYVKVGVAKTTMFGPTLTSIEAYDSKPGEDTENGYVYSKIFEKSNGKMTTRTVILTKFGKEYSFTIPTKKGEKGEVEEDPDIVAALSKLSEGGSVWVQATGSKLIAIEPYTDPQSGKLVKIGETEIDSHKIPSAEVETDGGKTVTLLVPVKPVGKLMAVDTAVNSQLHRLHPNAQIEFRTREDGDKLWIREIVAAPKGGEKKSAVATTQAALKK